MNYKSKYSYFPSPSDICTSVNISPEGVLSVEENTIVILNCTAEDGEALNALLLFGGMKGSAKSLDSEVPFVRDTVNEVKVYSFGPVDRSDNGTRFDCRNSQTGKNSNESLLYISCTFLK